ncbi:hypothetical protein [Blastomonas aquatica]|uniref:Lipoprotein n=1 Tax=Blastomonas aquatica TaxID=1510276 RepID=A0ABQ1IUG0_9SPHN|nr:hypothetical protein [Blastomonas aquatica]GGB52815.1 hypothetical protein GCM10010833_04370 [Blastomonas aquatica]
MKRLTAIVMGAALLSGCAERKMPGSTVLDGLLAFEDPAMCRPGAEMARFLQAMVVVDPQAVLDPDKHLRSGRIDAPRSLAAHFGRIEMTRHDGWTAFSVRVSGTMLGLPLHAIHQTFPEGGDPGDLSFEFAVPAGAAFSALRGGGFPVEINRDVSLGPPDGYELFVSLQASPDAPDRSLLTCGYR